MSSRHSKKNKNIGDGFGTIGDGFGRGDGGFVIIGDGFGGGDGGFDAIGNALGANGRWRAGQAGWLGCTSSCCGV